MLTIRGIYFNLLLKYSNNVVFFLFSSNVAQAVCCDLNRIFKLANLCQIARNRVSLEHLTSTVSSTCSNARLFRQQSLSISRDCSAAHLHLRMRLMGLCVWIEREYRPLTARPQLKRAVITTSAPLDGPESKRTQDNEREHSGALGEQLGRRAWTPTTALVTLARYC